MIEADIIKIKKKGRIKYPITKPEAVIDENGKNILQLIQVGSGYDDTKIKEDITSLQQSKADKSELTELSERIDNLPSAESDVFKAIYGTTTYEEVSEAYNQGKIIHCDYESRCYELALFTGNIAWFSCVNTTTSYLLMLNADSSWSKASYGLENAGNRVDTIQADAKPYQYPSAKAVYDALQNLPQGGSATTPDWNANEGEAGFIKNKPFNLVIQNIDFELYDDKVSTYISDIYDYDGFYILDKPVQFNGNYNFTIDYLEGFEQYRGITIELQSSDIIVTPNYIDTEFGDTIEGFLDYCNRIIKLFKIKVIDNLFIPDTVLKTTPQPLSDENKNQALSNLGIDPIVWKYICNPCVIKNGEQVPEDLLGNQDTFKYTNRGMYIVYDEGSGSNYTIEEVTSTEIYLYTGGYVAIINGCWEVN